MICMYCGDTGSEMFQVNQATKPKFHPNRWLKIGNCCEACHTAGATIQYEFGSKPPKEKVDDQSR